MIRVEITFFGAFRKFLGESDENIILEISKPITVGSLRELIADKLASLGTGFSGRGLLEKSALANDETVLDNQWLISRPMRLAVLPPVCGG